MWVEVQFWRAAAFSKNLQNLKKNQFQDQNSTVSCILTAKNFSQLSFDVFKTKINFQHGVVSSFLMIGHCISHFSKIEYLHSQLKQQY